MAIQSVLCVFGRNTDLIYPLNAILGFGIGGLLPASIVPAQSAVSDDGQETIGGLIQLCRNIRGAVGIPILTILLGTQRKISEAADFTFKFAFLFLFARLGFCIGTRFKNSSKT